MTHYWGDIPFLVRRRSDGKVLEDARLCATATKTAGLSELRRTTAAPRPSAGWLCEQYQHRRHDVDRRRRPALPTRDHLTPRQCALRGRGCGGNHASEFAVVDWTTGIQSTQRAAAGHHQTNHRGCPQKRRRFGSGHVPDRVGISAVALESTSIHTAPARNEVNR